MEGNWTSVAVLALVIAQAILAAPAAPARAQAVGSDDKESASDLAKQLQNPVVNLISVPFQNNTNFGYGHFNKTQNVLDIQPVIPFHVTSDWNIITRTILPIVAQPRLRWGPINGAPDRRRSPCGSTDPGSMAPWSAICGPSAARKPAAPRPIS